MNWAGNRADNGDAAEFAARVAPGFRSREEDPRPLIRIVHVALQLETGGMERLLVEIARHTDRSRFQLEFVALERGGRLAGEIEALGWPVTVLGAGPGLRPSVVGRLARFFGSRRADVVHSHNTKPLLYAGLAARLAGVSCMVHSRHGQRQGASARQDLMFNAASRCVDRMICVSKQVASCCEREGVRGDLLRVIWNGVDVERFAGVRRKADGPAVFVGRLSAEKDVELLLRAMARVVQEIPSLSLRVAGSGACERGLKELSNELGIAGKVEFLGEVSDVSKVMDGASMLVLPSKTEGLPLSVLEGMAGGLPVVATRVGGTPEAVVEGETGLLVESGDEAGLAGAMLRVLRDAALAQRMGEAGRARADEFFGVRGMVARYEALYDEVLNAKGNGMEARAA